MINNYEDFKKQVFSITSIDLNAYKEKQMKRRIDTLIARNKYDGYESYIKAIKSDSKLLDEFVNYLTINVSEFYRNPALWKKLEDIILPELINKFGTRLKIWSAACSTGDEPYSLAMVLAKKVPMRDIKIYATDIDDQVLEKAKDGVYSANSLKGLPDEYKNKYFEKMGDRYYKISDDIKKCVEFKKSNLLKDAYPQGCHLIVCRNVLIYLIYIRSLISHLFRVAACLLVIQNRLLTIRILVMSIMNCSFIEKSNYCICCFMDDIHGQHIFYCLSVII